MRRTGASGSPQNMKTFKLPQVGSRINVETFFQQLLTERIQGFRDDKERQTTKDLQTKSTNPSINQELLRTALQWS